MAKNTGTDYEKLIRDIYDQILHLDGVKNVEVQHNVNLPGKSGAAHQIDVYWKFVLAGIEYQVIIQAKDWVAAVDQGEVLKFTAVLDDLPGQPRGVMVARSGFQSGASTVARNHGIVLYVLRDVRESDFAGLVKKIDVGLDIYVPEFRSIEIIWDKKWIKENQVTASRFATNTDFMFVADSNGKRLKTMTSLLHDLINPQLQEYDWKASELVFEGSRFLETDDQTYPRVKFLGIRAEVRVSKTGRKMTITYKDVFQKIFASLTGEDTFLVASDGRVSRRSQVPGADGQA
jgi:hypothetical protein